MIIKNGTVNRGNIFVRAISVIQVTNTKQINFIKMDKEAVRNSSEEDLKSLGLNERGHLICLKCFSLECENNKSHDSSLPIEIKKNELAISVKKVGTDRLSTSPNVSRLKKESVLPGWMNYDNLKNKCIGVRSSRGGGIRTVHFRNEIDASVILDEIKTVFSMWQK